MPAPSRYSRVTFNQRPGGARGYHVRGRVRRRRQCYRIPAPSYFSSDRTVNCCRSGRNRQAASPGSRSRESSRGRPRAGSIPSVRWSRARPPRRCWRSRSWRKWIVGHDRPPQYGKIVESTNAYWCNPVVPVFMSYPKSCCRQTRSSRSNGGPASTSPGSQRRVVLQFLSSADVIGVVPVPAVARVDASEELRVRDRGARLDPIGHVLLQRRWLAVELDRLVDRDAASPTTARGWRRPTNRRVARSARSRGFRSRNSGTRSRFNAHC